MVSVLQLLTVMVKFGYYDDSADIELFLPSIHKLLNAGEDVPLRKTLDVTFKDEGKGSIVHVKY